MDFMERVRACNPHVTLLRSRSVRGYASRARKIGGTLDTKESRAALAPAVERAMSAQLAARRLDTALEQNDMRLFMMTLKEVIRTRGGFTTTARKTGLNRTALYKIVSVQGNPVLSTLVLLLSVVGLRLAVAPLGGSQTGRSSPPASPGPEAGDLRDEIS
jgi:probable addiction module antidote protein